ncbi:hypothetical protein [Streptomyces sp.]|uniref:hypothetical protein n=1 Tax=Streptomyces sp. TaxID=1931 RepID=UPI002D779506|nr:hypothetical protein [Streptomyces sp.]HET6357135.1 hypothetical protein [Streptomyces sp.]
MTLDEAVAAVSPWGEPKVRTRRNRPFVNISTSCDGIGVQVLLERESRVTAIELWWPGEGKASSTRVLLDGDDVFRTPAEEIFQRAAARGRTVDDSQVEYPVVPGVSLGFTRQTSQEVPRDSEGLPLYVTSVLIGGEGYYDFRYENRD